MYTLFASQQQSRVSAFFAKGDQGVRCLRRGLSEESGSVKDKEDGLLLFFDNLYPLRLGIWDIRHWLVKLDSGMAERLVRYAVPKELNADIVQIIPSIKEGGALVRLRLGDGAMTTRTETLARIASNLQENPPRLWFSPLKQLEAFVVRGDPWINDLYRFPSPRVKVVFEGPELSQETLYGLFRPYGKLLDIYPQPAASKDLPKFATLQFQRARSATAARNCLHGFQEGATRISVSYERQLKAHVLKDWLVNHPRFTVPASAALIASLTVAIFDPVRTFMIEQSIGRTFHFEDSSVVRWFKANTLGLLPRRRRETATKTGWLEREETNKQIAQWLIENNNTFIVVQGPRGSGKRELIVDQVLGRRKNILLFDCESIVERHGDSAAITAVASQVGYFPVFSWANSISSLIDLAAQGITGQSPGFTETFDSQFKKILSTTATALKRLALRDKDKKGTLRDEEYLELHPESRPVVVIQNFLHKQEGSEIIYDNLAAWAAALAETNVAHVIFVTNDAGYAKVLTKALPDRVLKVVTLGMPNLQVAKQYVLHRLEGYAFPDKEMEERELDEGIKVLGGRLTDLDILAQRIKAGERPISAVDAIVAQSATEVIKLYFSPDAKRSWNTLQAWTVLKALAEHDDVRYQEILLDSAFKSDDEPLKGLEGAEMIITVNSNGRPSGIRVGKPVYRAAFRRLMQDPALFAQMELKRYGVLTKAETDNIAKAEEELCMLRGLNLSQTRDRIQYLLEKLASSQKKIVDYEEKQVTLKRILLTEF